MIEWKEPVDRRGRGNRWDAIAAELRQHPGQWGVVAHDVPASTASQIKSGRLRAFRPAGSFEAVARGTGARNRAADLFVRYIGEDGTP